jgi:hypothetical protein
MGALGGVRARIGERLKAVTRLNFRTGYPEATDGLRNIDRVWGAAYRGMTSWFEPEVCHERWTREECVA